MKISSILILLISIFSIDLMAQCEYPVSEPIAVGTFNDCTNLAPGFTGTPHDVSLAQPSCGVGPFFGEWFSFTTGPSGSVVLDFENLGEGLVYASMFIVDGCFGAEDQLFCSPLSTNVYSNVDLLPSTQYLIFVYSDGTSPPSSYTLCLQDNPCGTDIPNFSFASNLSHHGMTVNWDNTDPLPAGGKFIIRYHEFGNSPNFMYKIVPNGAGTSGYVSGLNADTRYVFRIGSKCIGQTVATFSDTFSVKTKPLPCLIPQNGGHVGNPGGTLDLFWDDMGAVGYKVRVLDTTWHYYNVATNFAVIPVQEGASYSWQVRSLCENGRGSSYNLEQGFVYSGGRLASQESMIEQLVYPNPASSAIRLNLISENDALGEISILDIRGRIMYDDVIPLVRGNNNPLLDISSLQNGVYIVKLILGDQTWQRRLVVEK